MKQGSTDDPFAEDPEPRSETEAGQEQTEPGIGNSIANDSTPQSPGANATETNPDDPSSTSSTSRTLPYIHKRGAVKEGRTQRPVYLRPYNEDRIPELIDAVEEQLGEEITKTDLLEAAMETAIENPRIVAAILRTERYGYDWE